MALQTPTQGFNAANTHVGVTGALRTAPLGTKVPTGFGQKYDDTIYKNLGYVSPDGVEINFDEDTNEYIPWQEMTAIRRDITKSVKTVKLTLWESSKDNASLFFGVPGGNITVGDDNCWYFDEAGVPDFEHTQLVIDVLDGSKAMKIILLDAQITERSGVTFKRDEMIGFELTFSGYPAGAEYASQNLQGKTARWLFSEGWDSTGVKGETTSAEDGQAALKVVTASLANATKTQAYNATLAATGGDNTYTWAVTAGQLPAGLTLNGNKITGTPTAQATTQQFTVTVTDGAKKTATKQLTITVAG